MRLFSLFLGLVCGVGLQEDLLDGVYVVARGGLEVFGEFEDVVVFGFVEDA